MVDIQISETQITPTMLKAGEATYNAFWETSRDISDLHDLCAAVYVAMETARQKEDFEQFIAARPQISNDN